MSGLLKMPVSLKFNKFQKTSVSLPCRSHPSTVGIEEELNKIKSTYSAKSSANDIYHRLSKLVELYHFLGNLLLLPGTQNLVSLNPNAMWVEEVMDGSMKLLDICSGIRDIVLQMQEHFRDLQCALRMRRDRTRIGISIRNYISCRKKVKKDVKELITSLKQFEKVLGLVADHDNYHLTAVIRVLIEVTEMTVSIFQCLLFSISAPFYKTNGWSLVVVKRKYKGNVSCKEYDQPKGILNELEAADVSLINILNNDVEETSEIIQIAQHRFEGLRAKMLKIESGLDCMFRVLVKTRASLLNIISQ